MLHIYTNISRRPHSRIGVGKHNQPELRASKILKFILNEISEFFLCQNSEILRDTSWLDLVHDPDYVAFLEDAHSSLPSSRDPDWTDETGALIPNHFIRQKPKKGGKIPTYKLSGYYGSDYMSPIYSDTFTNAMIAASQAYRAASEAGHSGGLKYALTCSPGHHAKYDTYGGYCFLNNAAISAYRLSELISGKIGILDVDYHHGSTSIIEENPRFRERFFACSIHGNPVNEYPTFEGYAGQSTDQTLNIPLEGGATWEIYAEALKDGLEFLTKKNISALVIAFGADTYKDDPDVGEKYRFALDVPDYRKMGSLIRASVGKIPIVVTQEGGYDMEHVGKIVCGFLSGLAQIR